MVVPSLFRTPLLAAVLLSAGAAAAAPIVDDGLVSYEVVDGGIPAPLAGAAGDPARGRAIAAGRAGNCLACHHMPIPEQPFQGTVGPDLAGVGGRYTVAQLRLRLVNAKLIGESTVMPAFYRVDGLRRVAAQYRGRPVLDAGQIEDVVAYLTTLTEVIE